MTVGVVGGEAVADEVAATLAAADVVTSEAADIVAEAPDWIVASGRGALLELARAGVDVPVLALADENDRHYGGEIPTVQRADLQAAVKAVESGEVTDVSRTPLAVAVDGTEVGRALFDVMLVTDEPARICEYSVRTAREQVASFRADGVVVATPAGSSGYASAAGGPHLEGEPGVVSVVPVAAFVTDTDHWVLDADGVRIGVEREESVAVVADGEPVERVGLDASVVLTPGPDVRLYDWSG